MLFSVQLPSDLESLPWETILNIINQALDPLIADMQEMNNSMKESDQIMLSAEESTFTEEEDFKLCFSRKDLSNLYSIIDEMVKFRSNFLATSKKFSEAKEYIDIKIVKAVGAIRQRIKNDLLGFAINDNNLRATSLLITAGANPNALIISPLSHHIGLAYDAMSYNFTYPLTWAVACGFIPMAKLLIEKGATIHAAQPGSGLFKIENLVYVATYKNKIDMAKFLIEDLRLNPNTPDLYLNTRRDTPIPDYTPLHIAAERGAIEIAKLLIQHGANIDAQSTNGETSLLYAVRVGHDKMVRLFLSHKADPNIPTNDRSGHETPLHVVASINEVKMGKLLLDHNADVNALDFYGQTPLAIAKLRGNKAMIKLLKQYNAK